MSVAVKDLDIADSLTAYDPNILKLTHSEGAAATENKLYTFGITPSKDEINDLIKWLGNNDYSPLFQTDHLSKLCCRHCIIKI